MGQEASGVADRGTLGAACGVDEGVSGQGTLESATELGCWRLGVLGIVGICADPGAVL